LQALHRDVAARTDRRGCRTASPRIASDQGSAPKIPTRSFRLAASTPSSWIISARFSAYDGVQVSTVAPKSWRIMICRFVLPPEIGITVVPSLSAP
jgi:hypothetical protein